MYKHMYRIEWKSLLTHLKGHGTWYNQDKETMLKHSVKIMNREYRGLIHHWVAKQESITVQKPTIVKFETHYYVTKTKHNTNGLSCP